MWNCESFLSSSPPSSFILDLTVSFLRKSLLLLTTWWLHLGVSIDLVETDVRASIWFELVLMLQPTFAYPDVATLGWRKYLISSQHYLPILMFHKTSFLPQPPSVSLQSASQRWSSLGFRKSFDILFFFSTTKISHSPQRKVCPLIRVS